MMMMADPEMQLTRHLTKYWLKGVDFDLDTNNQLWKTKRYHDLRI